MTPYRGNTVNCLSSSPMKNALDSESSRVLALNSNIEYPQPSPLEGCGTGPVAIFWDMENCQVPSDVRAEDVSGNIITAVRVHLAITNAVTLFNAYGDFSNFSKRLREGCQRTGVRLLDVPNGRKDASDKAILIDMFLFALDHKPPACIVLISGDVDFSPALHRLGQRGYTIILIVPSHVSVSSALTSAGEFVLDWPSVARGNVTFPDASFAHPSYSIMGYHISSTSGCNCELYNEDEAILYKGAVQSDYYHRSSPMYWNNPSLLSRESYRASYTLTDEHLVASSRMSTATPGLGDGPAADHITSVDDPLHSLKNQIVGLLDAFGGSLPLSNVPMEYWKTYRKALCVSDYGTSSLLHLCKKMADAFAVVGKGKKRLLCLKNVSADRTAPQFTGTPIILKKEPPSSADGNPVDVGSSSEEYSSDDRNVSATGKAPTEANDQMESFKQEMLELLVCYSCAVPVCAFTSHYEHRYKKSLDYQTLGVDGLDELIDRVSDVVTLYEDEATSEKYLVHNPAVN